MTTLLGLTLIQLVKDRHDQVIAGQNQCNFLNGFS
jgi:hypothetical protein